jgi:GNAT superfamily N-acetyltransferase
MVPTTAFQVRDAGLSPNDTDFLVAAFDSTIPQIVSLGNTGQWGTQPFSKKDGFLEATADDIVKSESFKETGQGERVRIMVAEVQDFANPGAKDGLFRRSDDNGRTWLAVGAITIRDEQFASHLLNIKDQQPLISEVIEAGRFVFIDVIISDHRVGSRRKGVGEALLRAAEDYARDNGKTAIYLDCYTGEGSGKLLQYVKVIWHPLKVVVTF